MRISSGSQALPLGHAERRITATMLPWIGVIVAAGGIAAAIVEAVIGSRAGIGMPTLAGGLALAAVAFLATLPLRRSQRLPRPAWVSTNPIAGRRYAANLSVVMTVTATVLIAWLLIARRDVTPARNPVWVLPWVLLAAAYAVAPLVLFVGRAVEERDQAFAAWLAGHPQAPSEVQQAARDAERRRPVTLPR
jgi:hypothetical protein